VPLWTKLNSDHRNSAGLPAGYPVLRPIDSPVSPGPGWTSFASQADIDLLRESLDTERRRIAYSFARVPKFGFPFEHVIDFREPITRPLAAGPHHIGGLPWICQTTNGTVSVGPTGLTIATLATFVTGTPTAPGLHVVPGTLARVPWIGARVSLETEFNGPSAAPQHWIVHLGMHNPAIVAGTLHAGQWCDGGWTGGPYAKVQLAGFGDSVAAVGALSARPIGLALSLYDKFPRVYARTSPGPYSLATSAQSNLFPTDPSYANTTPGLYVSNGNTLHAPQVTISRMTIRIY
jgi:hypothetical protein